MKLLDIGCGTAHIIESLAVNHERVIFIGLDVSSAMLKIAKLNTARLPNVILVKGDGLKLPFSDCSFDVVITRLAEYSPQEVHRVLKKGGFFFEYDLGPEANKEILEFFQGRIEKESFFFPNNLEEWKREVHEKVMAGGLSVESIDDYKEIEYYQSVEELMGLIEMVPLVKNFDREKDKETVEALAKRYLSKKGISKLRGITMRAHLNLVMR
jgi:ubiquinone/menaquinone biosynthesis C-methylase UbiE